MATKPEPIRQANKDVIEQYFATAMKIEVKEIESIIAKWRDGNMNSETAYHKLYDVIVPPEEDGS